MILSVLRRPQCPQPVVLLESDGNRSNGKKLGHWGLHPGNEKPFLPLEKRSEAELHDVGRTRAVHVHIWKKCPNSQSKNAVTQLAIMTSVLNSLAFLELWKKVLD